MMKDDLLEIGKIVNTHGIRGDPSYLTSWSIYL